jgi:DUF2911 family protein
MKMRSPVALVLTILACPVAAQRADSATFIIRLGHDTTAIERYVRTNRQLVAEAVQRSPVTMLHRLVVDFDARGAVSGGEWTLRPPGAQQPQTRRTVRFQGDSAIVETTQAGATRAQRIRASDAIPIAGPFYSPYELAMMRAVAGGSVVDTVMLLPGASTVAIRLQRFGRDSIAFNNQFDEPLRAHIDASGRLLHLHTPAFTTVERKAWLDLEGLTREFAARDAAGKALGPLSPRQTFRERVGAANLWLDFSQPARRGRPVWGALVPWGQVWRMGANDAAHLATDRTLEFGNVTVPPGTYTLFLLPAQHGWQLIINRATGMSGLEYDAANDVGRVALRVEPITRPVESFTLDVGETADGGTLSLSWDQTRASVGFRVLNR